MDNCYASVLSTQPGWNPQLLAVSALILLSKHILKSIEMFEKPIQEHHFLCLLQSIYQQHTVGPGMQRHSEQEDSSCNVSFKDYKSRAGRRS